MDLIWDKNVCQNKQSTIWHKDKQMNLRLSEYAGGLKTHTEWKFKI